MKNKLSIALVFIAAICLLARFLFPGDSIFISDEPNFQLALDQFVNAGKFPLTNFRGSSMAFPYGAGALYFYWPIRLFTNTPQLILLYHVFFVSSSLLFLFLGVKKLFGFFPASCALLMASTSPLLFLFSRHPWDNALLYPVSALLFFLFSVLENAGGQRKRLVLFFLGLVLGYGLTVHLMFGPVAVAAALAVFVFLLRKPEARSEKIFGLLCFSFGCCVFALPYLWEAVQVVAREKPLEHSKFQTRWGDGRNLWWTFQRTMIFYSLWGSKIYLNGVYPSFQAYVGSFFAFLFKVDISGWFGKIAGWSLPLVVAVNGLRRKHQPIAMYFLLFSFLLTIVVLNFLNIPTDPHYYNSVWWIVFVGFAWAVSRLGKKRNTVFLVFAAFTALVNISFLLFSAAYVHENSGARNGNYGTLLGAQQEAMRALCTKVGAEGWASTFLNHDKVFLHPYPLQFHLKYLPECKGKNILLVPGASEAQCAFHYPEDSLTSAKLLFECSRKI